METIIKKNNKPCICNGRMQDGLTFYSNLSVLELLRIRPVTYGEYNTIAVSYVVFVTYRSIYFTHNHEQYLATAL